MHLSIWQQHPEVIYCCTALYANDNTITSCVLFIPLTDLAADASWSQAETVYGSPLIQISLQWNRMFSWWCYKHISQPRASSCEIPTITLLACMLEGRGRPKASLISRPLFSFHAASNGSWVRADSACVKSYSEDSLQLNYVSQPRTGSRDILILSFLVCWRELNHSCKAD